MIYLMLFASLAFISASFFLKRSFVFLWFSLLTVLFYHLDALATTSYGFLFFSATYPSVSYSADAVDEVVFQATMILVSCSFFNAFWGRRTTLSRNAGVFVGRGYFSVSLVVFLYVVVVAYSVYANGGFLNILSSRQAFFSENLSALIALYLLPALVVASFIGVLISKRFSHKSLFFFMLIVSVALSLMTGSRSAFILGSIAPCIVYYLLFKYSGGFVVGFKSMFFVSVFMFALLYFSSAYRDYTRGEQDEVSFLVSPDSVAFDASTYIIQNDFRSSGSTYGAILTFWVPRVLWPEKPVSANYYLTERLFPERIGVSGGAEITASIVGEGFMNYGGYGFFSAAIFLFALIFFSESLLAKGGVYAPLALILIFRGVNLLRGDSLNTVVPLFFAGVFFVAIAYFSRVKGFYWGGR